MIFCRFKSENKYLESPSGYESYHIATNMSGRHLSSEDRRELARLTKILTQKIVQVVVQSRLGEKAFTKSKTPAQGSEWFNLGIEDIHEIAQETKRGLGGHLPDVGKPLVVEILLRTPESDSLVLELWTLRILDACDTSPARINPTIYNRMTVLLKSLLAVTRITPAYKLAFRQGPDSFIICYRVYLGDPNYDCLGEENHIQARLGQVTTPESTLLLCVSYRTQITLAPPSRSPAHDAIMLKSDHFKPEVSPRHCRRGADRGNDSSEATQASDDSQDAARLFTASPLDQPSTPRSRTSSDSSCRGYMQQQQQQQQAPERKVSVAFVDAKPPKPDDFFLPDIPFSNLLASTIEVQHEKKVEKYDGAANIQSNPAQEKNAQERAGPASGAATGATQHEVGEKAIMTTSDSSHKSTTSAHLKDEADFVMVELKTPFVGTYETGNDLGAFYRECQSAPPLRMFADTPEDEISDLTERLLTFEANMDEYNELVKSLHSENSPNSPD